MRDAGVLADPWALAGLKRREVTNAAVLAGLWSPASGGLTAIEFLAAFFDRLRLRPGGQMLPDRIALTSDYKVRTEDQPMGEGADRVDITIEGKSFLIGIEVKIDAGLQPNQLERYIAAIGRRAANRGKQAAVIFLARRRTDHLGIIQASWKDVELAGRSVAEKKGAAQSINRHLIKCFVARAALFEGGRN